LEMRCIFAAWAISISDAMCKLPKGGQILTATTGGGLD